MSETSERPTSRAAQVLDATLERMEQIGQISPGSRAELMARMDGDLRSVDADEAIGRLFDAIDAVGGGRYRNAAYQAPPDVLSRILDALPVTAKAREKLRAELSLKANSLTDVEALMESARRAAKDNGVAFDPEATADQIRRQHAGRVARLVVERLGERSARDYWAGDARPEIGPFEQKARDVIHHFRHDLARGLDLDQLAINWTTRLASYQPWEARRLFAQYLTTIDGARLTYNGEPLDPPDPWDPAFKPTREEQEDMDRRTEELRRLHPGMYQRM